MSTTFMIDNNILAISKAMFNNKIDWNKVTDEQKEQFFFIFNRYFSKNYPLEAYSLNNKNQNKSLGMDIWFEFMKNKPYPNWFWSKPKEKESTKDFTNKEKSMLLEHLDIKNDELIFLIQHHRDDLIEELDYLKKCNKI